jgi:hypothetical protein
MNRAESRKKWRELSDERRDGKPGDSEPGDPTE